MMTEKRNGESSWIRLIERHNRQMRQDTTNGRAQMLMVNDESCKTS